MVRAAGDGLRRVREGAFMATRKGAKSGPAASKRKAAAAADIAPDALLAHYRDMLLIRRFEEKAGQMYGMGLIGGFCHLYIGQEAVVVGMQAAIEAGDSVITSYRDHGHMLACGMDAKRRHGGADRAPRRLLQGQGRLHAHVQPRRRLLRRTWYRRRPGAPRQRHRLRPQVPGGRPHLA